MPTSTTVSRRSRSSTTRRRTSSGPSRNTNSRQQRDLSGLTCVPGFNPLVVGIDRRRTRFVSGKTYSLSGSTSTLRRGRLRSGGAIDCSPRVRDASNVTTETTAAVNVGPTVESYVEALSLTTGNSSSASTQASPGRAPSLRRTATACVIQSAAGNAWDPTQTHPPALLFRTRRTPSSTTDTATCSSRQ